MWYIQDESRKEGPKYWLGGTQTDGRTIGRKMVDIRLKASSVSRVHAKISVHKASFYAPPGSHEQTTAVSVVDFSAYGTFLKYPPNHIASRQEPAGHHRRLNKDDPTEVYEGALLAFGAPSAWWQVCWQHLRVFPSRLTPAARARSEEIGALTSLEVADQMSAKVTHLLTSSCVSTSQNFLLMLARNGHVVEPAWLEALLMIVQNACTAISVAESQGIAYTATCLPPEDNYLPPFSDEDVADYAPDVLRNVMKRTQKDKRKNMFKGIVFAFEGQDRSTWWAQIVESLGGDTVLTSVLSERPELKGRRILFVANNEVETIDGAQNISVPFTMEKGIIESILRADLTPIESALDIVRDEIFREKHKRVLNRNNPQKPIASLGGAYVADVATPGPLDAESDVESDASGPTEAFRASSHTNCNKFPKTVGTEQMTDGSTKPASEKVSKREDVKKKVQPFNVDVESQQKRIRSIRQRKESGDTNNEHNEAKAPQTENDITMEDGIDFDAEKDNDREFFPVPSAPPGPTLSEAPSRKGDVRPFRRRKLPSGTVVPLKRVKVLDETNIYNTGGRRLLISREDDDNAHSEANE